MARGNAEIVRPIYDHWGRGDWRPVFEIYHPEMEWGWSDEFPDLGGVYRDPENPNSRLRRWLSDWEHWRTEPDDFLEIGDHVVVLTRYLGRGRGSGVEIQQEGAHVFGLRDGKVIRLEIFASRARALEYVRAADAASET
jgi:ketosteroid isomerase-like protein